MPRYQEYFYLLSEGVTVLVVMATELEYGAHLKQLGIRPLITGVGPVKAATALTHALADLGANGGLPDVIINLGSAGSATLKQGAVYRVSRSDYRDMDASAFGFPKGQTPFCPHPVRIESAPVLPGFPSASCSSGANVVSDHMLTGADMADMEYSAINDVAMAFGVPVIGFKGISDGATPLTGELIQWMELLPAIDRNLAAAVAEIKIRLARGEITKDHLIQMPPHWKAEHLRFSKQ